MSRSRARANAITSLVAASAFVVAAAPRSSCAQTTGAVARPVVVSAVEPTPPNVLGFAARLSGANALSSDALRAALAEHGMLAPAPAESALAERLVRASEQALEHVAYGRSARTRDVVDAALRDVAPNLVALVRDTRSLRAVSDLCLFSVRAMQQQHHADEARAQATECLRLVPDLEPNPSVHPPEVRDLVDEIRRVTLAAPHPAVVVEAFPADPVGCAVLVNGRRVGQTPRARLPVTPGTYAVQVECDASRPGYVHMLRVEGEQDATVRVHARLEQTLRLEPVPHFAYVSDRELRVRARGDAIRLAALAGLNEALLVTPLQGGQVLLEQLRPSRDGAAVVASESLDASATPRAAWLRPAVPQTRASADEHRETHPANETSATAASAGAAAPDSPEVAASEPEEALLADGDTGDEAPRGLPSRSPGVLGFVLGGAGIVGAAVAWVTFANWLSLANHADAAFATDPDFASRIEKRDAHRTAPLVAGALGFSALTAAVPLWMPREDGVPLWSIAVGALGVASAVTGIVVWSRHGDLYPVTLTDNSGTCSPPATCTHDEMRPHQGIPLGPLLVMQAAPFLAVPLTYVARSLLSGRADVSVNASATELSLRWSGSF